MNATTAKVVSVSVSSPAEGSTATHQESIKQTFALKVQFNDDIRRFNLTELSFEPLVKRVAEVFKIPEAKLILKYQDEEGDLVTITSTDDLFDAQRLAAQRSAMLRLTASCNRKKKVEDAANIVLAPNAQPISRAAAPAPSSPVTDYKVQKEALREQKKLLKEEKKRLLKSGSSGAYKEQKKLLKEEKKELKSGKEELKAIKKEAKLIQKTELRSAREAIRENWRNMSHEDKMAIRKARQEARGHHGGDHGKAWKDMSREERIAIRVSRREARMAEGGHVCRNKIVGRFVKHVTIPDGTTFEPRQPFTKTWRMRNEGAEAWTDCKLVFVSRKNGDLMGAPEEVLIPSPVAPGSEVDVSVQMVAPEQPGRYVGFWRLSAVDGRKFGQRIWVKIDVVVSSSSSSDEKDNEAMLSQSGGFKQMEDEIEESFIDIKEKEEEEPAAKPTVAELLKQLKALGFSDVGRNIPLLKKHNGDINKVIADLIA